jgi:hypothetical protein
MDNTSNLVKNYGILILKKNSVLYCKTSSSYDDIIEKKQVNKDFI